MIENRTDADMWRALSAQQTEFSKLALAPQERRMHEFYAAKYRRIAEESEGASRLSRALEGER